MARGWEAQASWAMGGTRADGAATGITRTPLCLSDDTTRYNSGRCLQQMPPQPAFGASQSPTRLPITWVFVVILPPPIGAPATAGIVIVDSLVTS